MEIHRRVKFICMILPFVFFLGMASGALADDFEIEVVGVRRKGRATLCTFQGRGPYRKGAVLLVRVAPLILRAGINRVDLIESPVGARDIRVQVEEVGRGKKEKGNLQGRFRGQFRMTRAYRYEIRARYRTGTDGFSTPKTVVPLSSDRTVKLMASGRSKFEEIEQELAKLSRRLASSEEISEKEQKRFYSFYNKVDHWSGRTVLSAAAAVLVRACEEVYLNTVPEPVFSAELLTLGYSVDSRKDGDGFRFSLAGIRKGMRQAREIMPRECRIAILSLTAEILDRTIQRTLGKAHRKVFRKLRKYHTELISGFENDVVEDLLSRIDTLLLEIPAKGAIEKGDRRDLLSLHKEVRKTRTHLLTPYKK